MKPTLLVLAAGMGSRYGGLKQIDAVGPHGETIVDYSIFDALRAGFGKVTFVIRGDIEQEFRKQVSSRFLGHIEVEHVFQELNKLPAGYAVPQGRSKPWGTTHAILMATDAIHEPFAAINADDFYGRNSFKLLADHLMSEALDYAMVGFRLRNTLSEFGTVARGVCRLNGNESLQEIVELTRIERADSSIRNTDPRGEVTILTGDETVSMNCWGFAPNIFQLLEAGFRQFLERNGNDPKAECYIPTSVNEVVSSRKGKVKVLRTPDSWFGVTYREDRPRVIESIRELIQRGDYPEQLWA